MQGQLAQCMATMWEVCLIERVLVTRTEYGAPDLGCQMFGALKEAWNGTSVGGILEF
jgi:hypothetical protein